MREVDLRSDTLTRPTLEMRQAMASADVGDDVFGEDPTVRMLEEEVAALLGKEAALFVSSGTMGNQLAIRCQTEPGDEVIVGEGAHVAWYESGAGPALSGVQFQTVGRGGLFGARDVEEACKPRAYWCPRTSLVCVENTHNRGGGRVFPQVEIESIARAAKKEQLALHLDGARLWNASVASGTSVLDMAAWFDTVSVCFSKGLGAPVGSALVGSSDLIQRARRLRKMWGGGMRQVGILAACARYALAHHVARLSDDHANAKDFAGALLGITGVKVTLPETNIVHLEFDAPCALEMAEMLAKLGVRLSVTDPNRLRAVTHLGITRDDIGVATGTIRRVLLEGLR